mmetsp:Transcript_34649/g.74944  ORF Transcript_34649/g.74944 Transcript_34649/m.74944 type:complete len:197 (+) Transcript_34649:244-834(+)
MYHRVAPCRKAGSRLFCVADGSQQRQSARSGGSASQNGGDPLRERIYLEGSSSRYGGLRPEPVPVTHSAAFLQRSRGVWEEEYEASTSSGGGGRGGEVGSEYGRSGFELFVNDLDRKLAGVEEAPPEVAQAFSDAISSEAGKAARQGMVQAAKLTVDASVVVAKGAAKGAVPVVSWAVKQGAKGLLPQNPFKKEKK